MKYKYIQPEELDFNAFLANFSSNYSSLENTKQVMDVNVWAYGVCSTNPNPPEDDGWGGSPYNQPGCIPT